MLSRGIFRFFFFFYQKEKQKNIYIFLITNKKFLFRVSRFSTAKRRVESQPFIHRLRAQSRTCDRPRRRRLSSLFLQGIADRPNYCALSRYPSKRLAILYLYMSFIPGRPSSLRRSGDCTQTYEVFISCPFILPVHPLKENYRSVYNAYTLY